MLLLENVKGLLSSEQGRAFGTVLEELGNIGYWCEWKLLTANITESHKIGKECSLSDILEAQVANKYFLSTKAMDFLKRRAKDNAEKGRGFGAVFLPQLEQPIIKDMKQEDRLSAQPLTQDMALSETQGNPT
jgi:hypothetical protein